MANPKTDHFGKKAQSRTSTEDREEVTKMNVNVPKSFYKRIKQKALDEDTSVTEIVIRALSQYLNK